MWWFSLSVLHYVWSITVQHPAAICHYKVLPETLTVVFHWLMNWRKHSSCSLLTSLTFSGKKSKCECKKWTVRDMPYPISVYIFRSSWTPSLKSGDFFLLNKFEKTYLNLSQAAHSVSVRLSTKASSSRISQIQGLTRLPACSFAVLMLENFLLRYWSPLNLSLPHLSLKHFPQPKFYVQTRKEHLHGITERNVLDTVFSQLISLPWFLVTLDAKFSCRVTIPKA